MHLLHWLRQMQTMPGTPQALTPLKVARGGSSTQCTTINTLLERSQYLPSTKTLLYPSHGRFIRRPLRCAYKTGGPQSSRDHVSVLLPRRDMVDVDIT